VTHSQLNHRVTQKLQPLIILAFFVSPVKVGTMSKGLGEKLHIPKAMTDSFLKAFEQ
jgi:hypothetical protein